MCHMNIYTASGMITFWAKPNDIKGNHMSWGTVDEAQTLTSANMPAPPMPTPYPTSHMPLYSATGFHRPSQLYHHQYYPRPNPMPQQPYYPPNTVVPDRYPDINNNYSSLNRSIASRKRGRKERMPVPVPAVPTIQDPFLLI